MVNNVIPADATNPPVPTHAAARQVGASTQYRRWCRWAIWTLALTIFFAMGHLAGAVQKEQELLRATSIIAERFELRRPDGKLAASLAEGDKKQVLLSFFDANGKVRLAIGVTDNGAPHIAFFGADGGERLTLMIGPVIEEPAIILNDDEGSPAITLSHTRALGSHLMIGKAGRNRVAVGVTEKGMASIQFIDAKGDARIQLSLTDDAPELVFLEGRNVARACLKLDPDGAPSFRLFDQHNRERLIAQTDRDGRPSIRLIDPVKNTVKELQVDIN
jgi:hypothetical protein